MFTPSSNLFSSKSNNKNLINKITSWIKEELIICNVSESMINNYQIMVAEIQCNDLNCVPIETLIIIICLETNSNDKGNPMRWTDKILKPLIEVERNDISNLIFPSEWIDQSLNILDASNIINNKEAMIIPVDLSNTNDVTVVVMKPNNNKIKSKNSVDRNILKNIYDIDKIITDPSSNEDILQNTNELSIKSNYESSSSSSQFRSSSSTSTSSNSTIAIRHKKNGSTRPRGCPCCDPNNMDNIIDKIIMNMPPN